jgi:hypothetical protein
VRFKNKRIYWNEQFDFHLDQILAQGILWSLTLENQTAFYWLFILTSPLLLLDE